MLQITHDEQDLAAVAPLLCAGITTYSPRRHWRVGPGMKVGIVGLGGLGPVSYTHLPRQESRDINQGNQRHVEYVAGTNEARHFVGGVEVKGSSHYLRLVGNDSDNHARKPGEAHDDIAGKIGVYLEQFTVCLLYTSRCV